MKKTTKLSKLMDAYCKRVGVRMDQIRFLFDGDRIQPEQTPQSVKKKNVLLFLFVVFLVVVILIFTTSCVFTKYGIERFFFLYI